MLFYVIFIVVIILIYRNKKWDTKTKLLVTLLFIVLCVVLFMIGLIYGFDSGRYPDEPPLEETYMDKKE